LPARPAAAERCFAAVIRAVVDDPNTRGGRRVLVICHTSRSRRRPRRSASLAPHDLPRVPGIQVGIRTGAARFMLNSCPCRQQALRLMDRRRPVSGFASAQITSRRFEQLPSSGPGRDQVPPAFQEARVAGKIHDRCCQGDRVFAQHRTIVGRGGHRRRRSMTNRCSLNDLNRDRGRPGLGQSRRDRLTCATSSGGKNGATTDRA